MLRRRSTAPRTKCQVWVSSARSRSWIRLCCARSSSISPNSSGNARLQRSFDVTELADATFCVTACARSAFHCAEYTYSG